MSGLNARDTDWQSALKCGWKYRRFHNALYRDGKVEREAMSIALIIKRFFCRHAIYIEEIHRNGDCVEAKCIYCGKQFRASCGLDLPCKLKQCPEGAI